MKGKKINKIMEGITLFIAGAETKTFAKGQEVVYGSPEENSNTQENKSNSIINTMTYGDGMECDYGVEYPQERIENIGKIATITTIIITILLFIIGLITLLNKKITKKTKIIIVYIIGIILLGISGFLIVQFTNINSEIIIRLFIGIVALAIGLCVALNNKINKIVKIIISIIILVIFAMLLLFMQAY